MPDAKANLGDLVISKSGEFFIAGIVQTVSAGGIAVTMRIPTPDGWHTYPVKPDSRVASAPRVASRKGFRGDLDAIVKASPLFSDVTEARDFFTPYRA
jgi:hypothetical protein